MTAALTSPRPLTLAEALVLANAWFMRAVMLHSASTQLVADFGGEEPKYHVEGVLRVERAVAREQLDALVNELRAAADAALGEAHRVLAGVVSVEQGQAPGSLVPGASAGVVPEAGIVPLLQEAIVYNARSPQYPRSTL